MGRESINQSFADVGIGTGGDGGSCLFKYSANSRKNSVCLEWNSKKWEPREKVSKIRRSLMAGALQEPRSVNTSRWHRERYRYLHYGEVSQAAGWVFVS